MELTSEPADHPTNTQASQPGAITPALVREVADKVYNLMMRDLRIEQERQRRAIQSKTGGVYRMYTAGD
jgi:hypothetical protein